MARGAPQTRSRASSSNHSMSSFPFHLQSTQDLPEKSSPQHRSAGAGAWAGEQREQLSATMSPAALGNTIDHQRVAEAKRKAKSKPCLTECVSNTWKQKRPSVQPGLFIHPAERVPDGAGLAGTSEIIQFQLLPVPSLVSSIGVLLCIHFS